VAEITEQWSIESQVYGRFVITPEVMNTLISYRQLNKCDREAGGALIGCLRGSNIIEVHGLTLPQPSDRRTRNAFFRSNAHNKIVVDQWNVSNRSSYLVGLWHTHPEDTPSYSNVDQKDWLKVLNEGQYEGQSLIYIIVGTQDLRLWLCNKSNKHALLVGEYSLKKINTLRHLILSL